jgi:hypothetical protein
VQQSPYAYVLTSYAGPPEDQKPRGAPLVFTWPSTVRKFIRDTYTVNGNLVLPPPGRLQLTRHKVNPKAGQKPVADFIEIEAFLE